MDLCITRITRERIEKHNWIIYSFIFLGITICGYYVVLKQNLSLIWNVDGVGQYYPTFIYIGQYLQNFFTNLFHGNFSLPLYDLSIGLGEDIIGALNYYGFGDPLNLLAIFVTEQNSAYLFTFMFFLRLYMAGLTFQKYCLFMKMDKVASIFGALCYTFSGFAIVGGTCYIEWLAVLIYFPLILIGVENVFRKTGNPYVLIFSVTYGALCGFYYLYMVSLFLVLYSIIRLTVECGGGYKEYLKKGLICVGWYIVGICLAAPFLVPALAAYINSERSGSGILGILRIVLNIRLYFPVLNNDLIHVLFDLFHSRKNYLSGITVVQLVAVLVLFILPRSRRSLQLRIAVVIALIALHLPITGYLFNAFGETNDRWVFIVHFIVSVVLVHVASELQEVDIIINASKRFRFKQLSIFSIAFILIVVNIIGNIWFLYSLKDNWRIELVSYNNFNDYVDSPINYSEVLSSDNDVYRVSNDSLTNINGRPENIAMINHYYGLTYWFSMVNGNVQTYIDEIQNRKLHWRSYGVDNNPTYETLLGVKYCFRKRGKIIPDNYKLVEEILFNGERWEVYYNQDYFGMAYVRDILESRKLWSEKESNEEYFNSILKNIQLNQGRVIFDYNNKTNIISCNVNADENAELVLLMPYNGNWEAYVDGKPAEVCKVDIMYMSVPLKEQGNHEVVLVYSPIGFKIGILLMIVSVVIVTGRIFYNFNLNKAETKSL